MKHLYHPIPGGRVPVTREDRRAELARLSDGELLARCRGALAHQWARGIDRVELCRAECERRGKPEILAAARRQIVDERLERSACNRASIEALGLPIEKRREIYERILGELRAAHAAKQS